MITDLKCNKDKEILSKTLAFIRFPLIVMVVFIHAHVQYMIIGDKELDLNSFPAYTYCTEFIAEVLCRVAVPLFYLISGFLFFFKTNNFSKDIYLNKLKSRGRTLLLPYIIWNTIYILLFFIAQTLKIPTESTPIVDYTLRDWFYAYWGNPNKMNFPICYPLWFIRDLMVVMLFTPILFYLIKRLSWVFIFLLGITWIVFKNNNLIIADFSTFFFFSLGAVFGILKKNFVIMSIRPLPFVAIFYTALCFLAICEMPYYYIIFIRKVNILFGLAFFIGLSAYFIKKGKWKTNSFIGGSSFFIFAYHAIPLSVIIKFMLKILPFNAIDALTTFFGAPIITILIGLLIYFILKKCFPKFTNIITGGR